MHFAFDLLKYLDMFPQVLIVLVLISIIAKNVFSDIFLFSNNILEYIGISNFIKNILYDMYVAFLAWSSSYLLIRYMLTPNIDKDTSKTLKLNAIYGGLGGATTVLFRHFI
jgi:hypothetical protein